MTAAHACHEVVWSAHTADVHFWVLYALVAVGMLILIARGRPRGAR